MSTRQTLRDFLTSIGSVATSISLPIDPGSDTVIDSGDDLGVEPNTDRELMDIYGGSDGESLLGDYTSYVTSRNRYQIAPGAHAAVSPVRGSAQSTAENTSALSVFADSSLGSNAQSLNRSNSEIFDESGFPLESDIINKTGDPASTAPGGDTLLPGTVSATANSDTVSGQTVAVVASFAALKKYNRFSPTSTPSQFAKDDSGNVITAEEYVDSRPMRVQVGKGEHESEVIEVSADISQETLESVARSMILRAAGWDPTSAPEDASDPNTFFDSDIILTKYPKIVTRDQDFPDAFRAQDAHGMPALDNGESILAGRGDAIQKSISDAKYMRTRGATHTADQSFGDTTNDQAVQAGIAMAALAALVDVKLTNLTEYFESVSLNDDKILRGPYYVGSSLKSDLGDDVNAQTRALVHAFLFQPGIFSYTSCVREGLYACFGIKASKIGTNQGQSGTPASALGEISIVNNYRQEIRDIADNLRSLGYEEWKSPMKLSQGFWRAVSESALRNIQDINKAAQSANGADYVSCLVSMQESLAIKIVNVFGSLGYQRLILQDGISSEEVASGTQFKNPYGIDDYPSAPGTRQMKSRDGKLLGKASLAWRNSAIPSMFILPVEAMAASLDMDYTFDPEKGSNPIKGMLGSTLYDKTYAKLLRNDNSIPSIVAKLFEDRLSAEYVPFYFRDLRTNEIVAFHAFLERLSDGYSANYGDIRGFGRADPIMNYSSTSRSMSLSFWIVSTSREDFDEMWFKINKLTTFVYPQYTRGRLVQQSDKGVSLGAAFGQTVTFEQPFSQIAGGTPVIRMRIGDLIKSNYSRFNLGRIFGVGNDTFKSTAPIGTPVGDAINAIGSLRSVGGSPVDLRLLPFLAYAGSPMELLSVVNYLNGLVPNSTFNTIAQAAIDVAAETAARYLKNGFVNPLLDSDRTKFFETGAGTFLGEKGNNLAGPAADEEGIANFLGGRLILKARATPYTISISNSTRKMRLRRPVFVKYKSDASADSGPAFVMTLDDPTLGSEYNGAEVKVSYSDLCVDAAQVVNIATFPGWLLSIGAFAGLTGNITSVGSSAAASAISSTGAAPIDFPLADFLGSTGRTFTSPYNNPITRAFEDRMGEGLAGVVKQLSFTWMDVGAWEVDWNSRAPTACKVDITFAPIHDISPGLDSNGFNRAPIYNVGQIMHDAFGNTRSDGGNASRYFYKKGGAIAENAKNPQEK